MKTISLCMIVKDEAEVLERCLSSLEDIADEIIIVDTGSKDDTVNIARTYRAKTYSMEWEEDFSKARNYSFSKASMDYILWLDADDIILPKALKKLRALKQSLDGNADVYSMIYHYALDENDNVLLSFRRNRLVKREKNFKWHGAVHEYLEVNGVVIDTDICITHKRVKAPSDRNLKIYKRRIEKGIGLNIRDTYYYAKELYDHEEYEKAIDYFLDFIESEEGWKEDKIRACLKIAQYYTWIGLYQQSRSYCYKTFEYGKPKAEACCQMGNNYLEENKIEQAIYWYGLALKARDEGLAGYENPACSTWLPHLQLCMCYYKLGDIENAKKHNDEALKYNQFHESILHNQKFFSQL